LCGAALVSTASLPGYRVDLQSTPERIRAGAPVTLRLTVVESESGNPVQRFDTVHEKLLHLFIISQDLAHYQHIHPIQQADASFVIETTLPKKGRYYVVSDFSPVGGWPQVVRDSLVVSGTTPLLDVAAQLVPDAIFQKVVDGIRFKLTMDPSQPAAGLATVLSFELTDAQTELPLRDLQPYLGAWGHTVILHEDGRDYVHSHPRTEVQGRNGRRSTVPPPSIIFDTFFPRAGRYRMWLQVQRASRVSTVSFDLSVARVNSIVSWNGRHWSGLDGINGDVNGPVRAVATSGRYVYAGGDFTNAGSLRVNRIMRWDGREWSALGEGVNGPIWAIATIGNDIYVGGEFTTAGGLPANRVAKWDGHGWSPLGEGVTECRDTSSTPAVYAMAARGNNLYVGGRFSNAGTKTVNGIAKWNGTGWEPLGPGMRTGIYDGVVRALAVGNDFVYAGGSFKTAGAVVANNIARWDGSTWQALDGGLGGGLEQVLAIAVRDTDVYVGGDFTTAGTTNVSNLALWNGRKWYSLGIVTDAPVQAIASAQAGVYIAGSRFTLPSGDVANGVIKQQGTWQSVGAGIRNDRYMASVLALSIAGNRLYAAGGPFVIPADGNHPATRLTSNARVR
jgi:hypothetical protein